MVTSVSTSILYGRRSIYGTGLALAAYLVPVWRRGCCGCWHDRYGTWWYPFLFLPGKHDIWWYRSLLRMIGVVLMTLAGSINTLRSCLTPWLRLFVWQAWYLAISALTLLGRYWFYGNGLALVLGNIFFGNINFYFIFFNMEFNNIEFLFWIIKNIFMALI